VLSIRHGGRLEVSVFDAGLASLINVGQAVLSTGAEVLQANNRGGLVKSLTKTFRLRRVDEPLERLDENEGRASGVGDAFAPAATGGEPANVVRHPPVGQLPLILSPIWVGAPSLASLAPSLLGELTREILQEIGVGLDPSIAAGTQRVAEKP
jgi:hypothetical protein